jgi:UDP-N-acetylglucosamine--N-acetylmuramyl-(pentapeptide) pyrophosphoryl-undecaprenol N-acetylglucosamine transferase
MVLAQLETTPALLADLLTGLTRKRLLELAEKARALGKPGATLACANLCAELARAA